MKNIVLAAAAVATLGLTACGGSETTEANVADTNLEATADEALADVNAAGSEALDAAGNALDAAGNAVENAGAAVENAADAVETNGL